MKRFSYLMVIVLFSSLISSCIYPFEPHGIGQTAGIIVIEGDIIAGDTSFFEISYTQELTDITTNKSVVSAKVFVESSSGELLEGVIDSRGSRKGFSVNTTNLDFDQQYRLYVEMLNEKQFYSTWQTIERTPQIDSLSFYPDNDNNVMRFYVTTGGEANQQYYKWTYKEDWEYHSHFNSFFEYSYAMNEVNEITDNSNRYYCWDYDFSTSIMVANTAQLSENRLINHEIYSLERTNKKISYIYSVEVYQQVINEEAYVYWSTLAKNSDEAGGLFSPQPTELRGNLYCQNDSTILVLGYVGASTMSKKRLFVDQRTVLFWRSTESCEAPIILSSIDWRKYNKINYDVVDKVEEGMGVFTVTWAPSRCVDCRVKGGTKNKPAFWPNDHV